jgi:peptidylprolyl isomerase
VTHSNRAGFRHAKLVALALLAAVASMSGANTFAQAPMAQPAKAWAQMTSAELIAAAPADAWVPLPPEQTLYLEFEPSPGAAAVRVVIQLAPDFAPNHVAALKDLVRANFFDGRAIVRSQDNYVAQWGDGAAATALKLRGGAMPAEFDAPITTGFSPLTLKDRDTFAPKTGLWRNFPVAWDPRAKRYWLPHCYGMVGAGRDEAADSGGPAELYAVNGHSPRPLDRNVTLLGRVVEGMEHLATLPRGTEALGFYGPNQTKPKILTIRLASDLPAASRRPLQQLRTDHPIYRQIIESRRNRRDSWTRYKANALDICAAPLPVRLAP